MYDNKKKSDIIFIVIFLLLLIIPVLKINNQQYSLEENKTFAPKPRILKPIYGKDKQKFSNINIGYFKEFEDYINDRFFMRKELIDLYKNVLYHCAIRYPHLNNRFVDKKTKLIGRSYLPDILQHRMSISYYNVFTRNISNSLVGLKKYCERNNIKIYFLILPDKTSIYKPANVLYNSDKDVKDLIKRIDPKNEINIIFPFEELKNNDKKNTPIYYKTDHHLTNEGYYLVYELLMKEIKKSFPQIRIVDKSEYFTSKNRRVKIGLFMPYDNGSLYYLAGLTDKQFNEFLDYEYIYYNHKKIKDLKYEHIEKPYLLMDKFQYNEAPEYNALLIGDSNVEGMSLFLANTFKNFSKIRLNGPSAIHKNRNEEFKLLKYYKKVIENLKPDIIIFCIEYDFVKFLYLINKLI